MKILNWEIVSIILAPVIFYYLFQFNNVYVLMAFLLGIVSSYVFLYKDLKPASYIILSGFLIYFFRSDLIFLPSYLIGSNLAFLYFNFLQNEQKQFKILEISLLNTALISSLVFQSSIEKFRGFNKLISSEISYTVLLIMLIPLSLYFLSKVFKINKIGIAIITTVIAASYSAFCFNFFKEIGVGTILIPLIAGLIVGIINIFVKNRSIIINLNEFVLLILIPYQVAGLLGICLSFLSAIIYISIVGSILEKDLNSFKNTILVLIPLLFIFASSEINENKGIITRFNLVSGYQAAWIFMLLVLLKYSKKYLEKLKTILIENDIIKSFPLFVSVFTIAIIAIIIKFGKVEALSSLPLVISIYLFLISFVESKKKKENINHIETMSGLLSAISFWILTR